MSERQTALHAAHERLEARFTDFGGWSMPVRYASDTAEHHAVRRGAGIFDLSHMGEVEVTGPQAGAFLDHALVGVLSGIGVGRAKYSVIVDEDGRVLDDLITYRLGEDRYLVVPNAGNQDTVVEALQRRAEGFDVTVRNQGPETSLIAAPGPRALEVLRATGLDPAEEVAGLKYYACAVARCGGADVLAARTGYTGEDGFELYCANADAETLWNALLATAEELGTEDAPVQPAGLAARDSLRPEAGMPPHGHELSTESTPGEAGRGKAAWRSPCARRTRPGPAPWATTPWPPCCRTPPSAPWSGWRASDASPSVPGTRCSRGSGPSVRSPVVCPRPPSASPWPWPSWPRTPSRRSPPGT